MSEISIYIITILISIVLGMILVYISGLRLHPAKEKIKMKKEDLSPEELKEPLDYKLFDEINSVIGSAEKSKAVVRKIAEVFEEEVKKKIEATSSEIKQKYESLILEKSKNEEVAWKKYKEILSEKRETEAVIRSIAEGLVVVDDKGNVIMMNPAAERLLGVSYKEKIGKSILEGLKDEQIVSLVKGTPSGEDKEIELISPNEETKKILRASSAVIEDENGKPVGMVSILSDITKQKELDRLKSNFVSSVTHELRTPLVAMEKSISLLLTENIPESQQREFLSIAQRNLKRLTSLINDLLDLSKLEAGKMEIKRQLCSIESVIDEAISGLKTWAETKSIQINKVIEENLPDVNIDPNRIIQVLTNLIGNAIKFTPPSGKITVEAKFIRTNNELEVAVQDTGIGIAKEDLPHIFDKFFQVGERALTDISGTGIGLSIAKEIIQLHKGRIWAESEKGKGARFIFRLPLI
jgi:PAS domain S-box-containing protein